MTRSVRRRLSRGLAALGVLAGVGATAIGAIAQDPQPASGLAVQLQSGELAGSADAPRLTLAVAPDAPAGAAVSALLRLENTSGARVEGLKILEFLVPVPGQTAGPPTVALKLAGVAQPAAGWTIEPGKTLPVTLTVSNVDPSAPFEGLLVGVRDDTICRVLARVRVEKLGARLKFLSAGPDGTVKLAQGVNTLSVRLTAESAGPSAFDLDVVTAPLIGPNGFRVEPRVRVSGRASAAEAAPGAAAEPGVVHAHVHGPGLFSVDLDSDALAAAGTYSGSVELRPAIGEPQLVRLTIERTRSTPPFEIKPPDPVQDVTYALGHGTELFVTLRETAGQAVTLLRPEFASLARKEGAARVQAGAEVDHVVDAQGKPVAFPFLLEPGAIQLLRVGVSPLRRPGEYTGSLQFGSPDYAAIEQPVSLLKRHPGWFAALVILTGILLSFAQRLFFSRTRPRKLQQRDASNLMLRLGQMTRVLPEFNDREEEEAAWLVGEFQTVHDSADGLEATRKQLVLDSEKLKLFDQEVRVRAMVDTVTREKAVQKFRTLLRQALDLIRNPDATLEQCQQLAHQLGELPAELFTAARDSLEKQVDDLWDQVRSQLSDPGLEPVLRSDLENRVVDPLAAAKTQLLAAEELSDVESVRRGYDAARGEYARALVKALRRVLAGPVPAGFANEADWVRLGSDSVGPELNAADTAAGTDPAAAIDHYNWAYDRYLLGVIVALANEAKQHTRQLAQESQSLAQVPAGETPEQKTVREGRKSQVDTEKPQYETQVIDVLAGARGKLSQDKASEAAAAYQQALEAYNGLKTGIKASAARAPVTKPLAAVAGASGPSQGAQAMRAAPLDPATEVARIDRWLRRADLVVLALVLVLGTLTGLQTLWAGNPTWGNWEHLAAAFVWGAGLQQIAGLTADQFLDLIDRTMK